SDLGRNHDIRKLITPRGLVRPPRTHRRLPARSFRKWPFAKREPLGRKTQTGKVPFAQSGRRHSRGIERVKSPLRLGDAPPLMRDQPVQHTATGTSEKILKSGHGVPPSSPGISV